jgi:hypothetical protein
VAIRNPPPDTTPPVVNRIRISDDNPFNENDPIASTTSVKVRIVAADNAGGSGLGTFCIVRYYYDVVQRRWVESDCSFEPLPTPDASSGTTFTYTVDAVLPPFEGTAYAFVWVRDLAGNISRVPGFDVISFIPAGDIDITRNDVAVFRITLVPGQQITFTLPVVFGDVDVSVFDGVGVNANRIAVSANNGPVTETVSFGNTTGAAVTFQMEVRAVVNSRFRITYQLTGGAVADLSRSVLAPEKQVPTQSLVAGPPALRTAIGEPNTIYLPIAMRP